MLALPVGDGGAVLVPLRALLAHEVVEDVIAEDLAHELGGLEAVDGLTERVRQALAARGLLRQGQALLDALEARGDRRGEGEVGVGRGIGAAQLDAGGDVLARLVRGDAHERGAVLAAPGGVRGDLAGGDEALVGVHGGVGDERELGRVLEDTGDVVPRELGEVRLVLLLGGPEEVLAVMVEQGLVEEHRGARGRADGLGHERGVHALGGGLLLDDQARRHDVVGAAHGLGEAQLDAILGRAGGVIGVLHRDRHLLERERGLAAQVVGRVHGREVEVARVVQRHGVEVVIEVEVLHLGAHVGNEALLLGAREHVLEAAARVALEGLARRGVDVAEDARHAGLAGAPRQQGEGAGVREGEHVRLLEGGEAVDGRPVEADALLEGLLQLLGRNRERLEVSKHVREPEPHEADVALLDGPQDEVDVLLAAHLWHSSPVFRLGITYGRQRLIYVFRRCFRSDEPARDN